MEGFPKLAVPFWEVAIRRAISYNSILVSILGSPILGDYHIER